MKYILEERYYLHEDASSTKFETWESYYAECKTKDEFNNFWNGAANSTDARKKLGYFKSEFGDNATQIKALGAPFIETLKEYGFEENENIFIAWLKLLNKHVPNKVGIKTITMSDMRVLKTAYEDKYLNDNDFKLTGKLAKFNLIFNPNFYDLQAEEQSDLLMLQKSFENSNELKDISDVGLAFANLYSNTGKPDDLQYAIAPGAKLRPTVKIKNLLAKFGMDKPSIAEDQIAELLKNIDNPKTVKKAIVYLYDAFKLLMPKVIDSVNNQTKGLLDKERKAYAKGLSLEDQNILNKQFQFSKGNPYNAKQAASLLLQLLGKLGTTT